MSQQPLEMNRIKQVQQLSADGVANKEIKRRTGISLKTIRKYLRKLVVLDELEVRQIPDKELAAIVYNNDTSPVAGSRREVLQAHFEYAKKELHHTGVNKQNLWLEYREQHPNDGYSYSQYCDLFRKWLKHTNPAFHWQYRPGEFTQMDFAGKKLFYVDKSTGEIIYCEGFIAVLPASGFTFCYAIPSQQTEDLATCINQLVKYIGGLTKTMLCDNFAAAVKKADRYEPIFTEVCNQLSAHYNTTFSATRVATPTDKGMVERAVNIVYSNIYARLRKDPSGSLEELNRKIRKWLDIMNDKAYKGEPESRRQIFIRLEQATLKPLPSSPFLVKKCKQVTVQSNYAIQLPDNKHYYTVPYQYVGKQVRVYYNRQTLEVYYQYELIAHHIRTSIEPQFNRIAEHMPDNHRHMVAAQGWTVPDLLARAVLVGPYTRQAADRILHSSIYPEQNYRACNAMIVLQNKYGRDRLEATCLRVASIKRPTLKMIRTILITGQDKQPLLFTPDIPVPRHGNIRGPEQYR